MRTRSASPRRRRGLAPLWLLGGIAVLALGAPSAALPLGIPSGGASPIGSPAVVEQEREMPRAEPSSPADTTRKGVGRVIVTPGLIVVDGETIRVTGRSGEEGKIIVGGEEGEKEGEEEGGLSVKRGDIVRIGEAVTVGPSEKVQGDVVAIGGSVTVKGIVTGDAVAIGGDVTVESMGEVHGAAVSVGGKVKRLPGGKVGEEEVSVGSFPPLHLGLGLWPPLRFAHPFLSPTFAVVRALVWLGVLILLGCGVALFFPRQMALIEETVRRSPFRMGVVGFLGELLVVPALLILTVLLAVTIIGIPLIFIVVPLAFLAVVGGLFLGYFAVGLSVERTVEARTPLRPASLYGRVALGILALMSIALLGRLLGLGGWAMAPATTALGILSWVIWYMAMTVGLGAVIITRFGTRSPGPWIPAPAGEGAPPASPA